uniref:Antitoxin n=1 Tax=Chlorobium chlorochromatii (strain CaD3) TaxID=340177 RepID=Q3APS3_CHLCH
MNAVSLNELRNNPQQVMDMVCDRHEPVIVIRKNGEKTVMLSYSDFSSMQETLYLLSSPTMAERLRESLESYSNGMGIEEALLQLDLQSRALLAEKLLNSLDTPSMTENEQLWAEEALRRYKEMKESKTQGKLASQVMQEALAELQ